MARLLVILILVSLTNYGLNFLLIDAGDSKRTVLTFPTRWKMIGSKQKQSRDQGYRVVCRLPELAK